MVQYTEAEIRAAVEEANSVGPTPSPTPTFPSRLCVPRERASRSIEHGNLIDAESAAVMAQHRCYLVPTLVIYDQVAKVGRQLNFPAESLAKLDTVLGAGFAANETAAGAGVELGFGTDLLGETHDAQASEFALRARVQAAAEVVRSATTVKAALLGRPAELGLIAPGAYADVLLVDGDPLTDIGVLTGQGERLDLIARSGEIVVNRVS